MPISKILLFMSLLLISLRDTIDPEEYGSTMVSFKKKNSSSIKENQPSTKSIQTDSPISNKLEIRSQSSVEPSSNNVFFIILFIIGFILFLFSYLEYVKKYNYYIADIPMREII